MHQKYVPGVILELWAGGGVIQPHFSQNTPKFGFGDAKKVYEKRGKQLSIFKIEKIPSFSHDATKFGFGDGKMEKIVYGKRGKKYSF